MPTSRVISMSARLGVGYVPFLPFGLKCLTFRLPKPEAPILVTVGDHLRARRKVLGLTQAEAAKLIGVVRDAVAKWELGLRQLDRRNMPSVIRFLGYDPQPPAHTFGESILRVRRALGMNQPQIAQALGVPCPSLGSWERGLCIPSARRRALVEAKLKELLASVATPAA
jgi:transcriptional regulator with XRE-family HTH domain